MFMYRNVILLQLLQNVPDAAPRHLSRVSSLASGKASEPPALDMGTADPILIYPLVLLFPYFLLAHL